MTTKQHQETRQKSTHLTYRRRPPPLSHRYATVQAKEVIEMMLIATADEILRKGLEMGGFDLRRQQSVKQANDLFETIQSIVRFQSNRLCTDYWGSSNYTYCRGSCWFKIISVEKLLIAMNFLKCYQSEEVRSGQFRVSEEEQEIDSIASGFCMLSLYWPFGYDRVVLVKRLRHSFSVSLRHLPV
jgi:hypothetical protein